MMSWGRGGLKVLTDSRPSLQCDRQIITGVTSCDFVKVKGLKNTGRCFQKTPRRHSMMSPVTKVSSRLRTLKAGICILPFFILPTSFMIRGRRYHLVFAFPVTELWLSAGGAIFLAALGRNDELNSFCDPLFYTKRKEMQYSIVLKYHRFSF